MFLDYGLAMADPVEMTLGWRFAGAGTFLIGLKMLEHCSALPTSGGMYHWSADLGGPTWVWFTAWLNIVGPAAAIADVWLIPYGLHPVSVPHEIWKPPWEVAEENPVSLNTNP